MRTDNKANKNVREQKFQQTNDAKAKCELKSAHPNFMQIRAVGFHVIPNFQQIHGVYIHAVPNFMQIHAVLGGSSSL